MGTGQQESAMVSAATTEQEAVLARPASVARMFLDRVAATPEGGA